MDEDTMPSRRQVLQTLGISSAAGLSGCLSVVTSDSEKKESKETFSEEWYGDLETPVPAGQETCTSRDGIERDPEALNAKETVQYQFHPNYKEDQVYADNPTQMCANCQFFCPAQPPNEDTPDIVGACAVVEGGVRSEDWCALWQPAELISQLE